MKLCSPNSRQIWKKWFVFCLNGSGWKHSSNPAMVNGQKRLEKPPFKCSFTITHAAIQGVVQGLLHLCLTTWATKENGVWMGVISLSDRRDQVCAYLQYLVAFVNPAVPACNTVPLHLQINRTKIIRIAFHHAFSLCCSFNNLTQSSFVSSMQYQYLKQHCPPPPANKPNVTLLESS